MERFLRSSGIEDRRFGFFVLRNRQIEELANFEEFPAPFSKKSVQAFAQSPERSSEQRADLDLRADLQAGRSVRRLTLRRPSDGWLARAESEEEEGG